MAPNTCTALIHISEEQKKSPAYIRGQLECLFRSDKLLKEGVAVLFHRHKYGDFLYLPLIEGSGSPEPPVEGPR